MNTAPEVAVPRQAGSPLEAFTGPIPRTKTGPIYGAGLAVVAFAMVLLPLLYVGLIALVAWAVLLHLRYDFWIFEGGGAIILRIILYLGPAVAGGILVFFMVKPLFAAKAPRPESIALDPASEPLLFAFVQKISSMVGAPAPCRIDVDCQVNASASLRRGFYSTDLVLTIGLPLVSGLDMRQFAGVLAHEFGHFAQGAGMRLTYVIRKINFWFARVVHERDAWDLKLEHAAKHSDWRIRIVLHMARGCVWLSRRLLWVLMHAGNAISCFMLRQMEYDADSYEAKLAGSDAFEATAERLRVLNVATQTAYEDVRQSWASKRLPENLPLLINHKAGSLPPEVHDKLSASAASRKTAWFDTHPCDADRIRAARRLNQPGVFRLSEPAFGLFSRFSELSKRVTRHQYAKHFKLEFTDQNLMSAEEILRESTASAEAGAMARKFYGTVNISLKPLLATGALPASAADENALEKWREACQATNTLRAQAEKLSAEIAQLQTRLVRLTTAHCLARAGFKVEPKAFGLPENATTPLAQMTAAARGLQDANSAISARLAELDPFVAALRQRVTLALQLAQAPGNPPDPQAPALSNTASEGRPPEIVSGCLPPISGELAEFARLLAAVGAEMPRAHEIGSQLNAFLLLAQNRPNHSRPAEVDRVLSDLASKMRALIDGIQQRLKPFPYPFPHARGRLTIAEYARFENPVPNEFQRVYSDANAHVDRLFALHFRLLGRLLALADAAETSLGKR